MATTLHKFLCLLFLSSVLIEVASTATCTCATTGLTSCAGFDTALTCLSGVTAANTCTTAEVATATTSVAEVTLAKALLGCSGVQGLTSSIIAVLTLAVMALLYKK